MEGLSISQDLTRKQKIRLLLIVHKLAYGEISNSVLATVFPQIANTIKMRFRVALI
jgi:hypothetical protein